MPVAQAYLKATNLKHLQRSSHLLKLTDFELARALTACQADLFVRILVGLIKISSRNVKVRTDCFEIVVRFLQRQATVPVWACFSLTQRLI